METCPDCGVKLPLHDGSTHPYLGGSASCWALFGEVLAREYSSPTRMKVHRLTVDAYAAQHPGQPERRTIQSVWVHLVGLHLVLDRGVAHRFARRVLSAVAEEGDRLAWLPPPPDLGAVTVADVARATDDAAHAVEVQRWAAAVWAAWRPHHGTIAAISERITTRL